MLQVLRVLGWGFAITAQRPPTEIAENAWPNRAAAENAPFSSSEAGTRFAILAPMGVRRVEELVAWQLALQFRDEVYGLLRGSEPARRDLRYHSQLCDALGSTVSNIVEGFHRGTTRQFAQFLSYARASHAEAETRLKDGIARGFFTADACAPALLLAKRCAMAILRLLQSLRRFM